MNPIIYACSSKEFKRAFRRILKCQFKRQPRVFLNEHGYASTSLVELNRTSPNETFYSHRIVKSDERRNSEQCTTGMEDIAKYSPESPTTPMFLRERPSKQKNKDRNSVQRTRHLTIEGTLSDEEKYEHAYSSKYCKPNSKPPHANTNDKSISHNKCSQRKTSYNIYQNEGEKCIPLIIINKDTLETDSVCDRNKCGVVTTDADKFEK